MARLTIPAVCTLALLLGASGRDARGFRPRGTNVGCGSLHHPGASRRLVGGTVTNPHEWPSICQLFVQFDDGYKAFSCAGTLVKNQEGDFYIVTAGHCGNAYGMPTERFEVRCGVHSLHGKNPHQDIFRIKRKLIHPKYIDENFIVYPNGTRAIVDSNELRALKIESKIISQVIAHDIAIFELDHQPEESDYIRAACLPVGPLHSGQTAVVAGWGLHYEGGQYAEKLQDIEMTIEDDIACAEAYEDTELIFNNTRFGSICAEPKNTEIGGGHCNGDSGGPMYALEAGQWTLAGVVSYAIGCGKDPAMDIFADVFSHLDWINAVINYNTVADFWTCDVSLQKITRGFSF